MTCRFIKGDETGFENKNNSTSLVLIEGQLTQNESGPSTATLFLSGLPDYITRSVSRTTFRFPTVGVAQSFGFDIPLHFRSGDKWYVPSNFVAAFDAGYLASVDRIDQVSPPLTDSGRLLWVSSDEITPRGTTTDVLREASEGGKQLRYGILLGIWGSLFSTVVWEVAKGLHRTSR
jgi:hypothetical protein